MDPVTTAIVAALSAGAASGATDAAKKAILEGYEGIKALLKKKFGDKADLTEAVDKLEANPTSEGRRVTLQEELKSANAASDPELLRTAQSLLELVKDLPQGQQHIQQVARGTGIAQASGGSTSSVSISGRIGRKEE
jgi:hypothetical protein